MTALASTATVGVFVVLTGCSAPAPTRQAPAPTRQAAAESVKPPSICAEEGDIPSAALGGLPVFAALGIPVTEAGGPTSVARRDVAAIGSLTAERVSSLDGIQHLCGLESLTVYSNDLHDLSLLRFTHRLRELSILRLEGNVHIVAGDVLGQQTPITDLAPVANLAELETLRLPRASVRDLRPLSQLAGLRVLDLHGNPIELIDGLHVLASLKYLDLSSTRIRDLAPLQHLRLEELDVAETSIADLAPLADMASLVSLDVSSTRVSDLRSLGTLPRLEVLRIGHTRVRDLAPLASHRSLRTVFASYSHVERGLDALLELPALELLDLCGTPMWQRANRPEHVRIVRALEKRGVRVVFHPKCGSG